MDASDVMPDGATVRLSVEELSVLNNALAAVCHAVRVSEGDFPILIGVTRPEGRELLRQLNRILHSVRGAASASGVAHPLSTSRE